MTDEWGIDGEYHDAHGDLRTIDPRTVEALRAIIGEPSAAHAPLVLRPGDAPAIGPGELTLEDGTVLEIADRLPQELPLGYHSFRTGSQSQAVIASPGRGHLPDGRAWGWAVQLYAAR